MVGAVELWFPGVGTVLWFPGVGTVLWFLGVGTVLWFPGVGTVLWFPGVGTVLWFPGVGTVLWFEGMGVGLMLLEVAGIVVGFDVTLRLGLGVVSDPLPAFSPSERDCTAELLD